MKKDLRWCLAAMKRINEKKEVFNPEKLAEIVNRWFPPPAPRYGDDPK